MATSQITTPAPIWEGVTFPRSQSQSVAEADLVLSLPRYSQAVGSIPRSPTLPHRPWGLTFTITGFLLSMGWGCSYGDPSEAPLKTSAQMQALRNSLHEPTHSSSSSRMGVFSLPTSYKLLPLKVNYPRGKIIFPFIRPKAPAFKQQGVVPRCRMLQFQPTSTLFQKCRL